MFTIPAINLAIAKWHKPIGDVFAIISTKFRIDSILPAERRMRIAGRINPNCGFRSLQTGVPEF